MSEKFALARRSRYWLAGARAPWTVLDPAPQPLNPEGLAEIDLLIDDGRIAAAGRGAAEADAETPRLSLGLKIVLPTFVDAHTHLDKGHIWPRAPNVARDFPCALQTVADDREARWTSSDVAARMEFSLRAAYAHGTSLMRTHLDSLGKQTRISWPVFAEARERWRGRIELQASPLFAIEHALDDAHMADVEAMIDEHGSGVLGAVTHMAPELRPALEAMFRLAERKGWELDFHVDETLDPEARSLCIVAETALAERFSGRILVGHCCSLARQADDERKRTIELVARARMSVVSLPMCNMFLMDRQAGRTPRWRGVTALQELQAAGVRTMIASDNTRDPFYAYGDLDMLEVWREGVRILHLDAPFADWAPAVFTRPALALGPEGGVIGVGAPADLVVTEARNFTELFSRPQSNRLVIRAGVGIESEPPDYRDLDSLEGLSL